MPEFGFEFLSDLAGVDTGAAMQVVYHLWSPTTPDWLRVIADGLSRLLADHVRQLPPALPQVHRRAPAQRRAEQQQEADEDDDAGEVEEDEQRDRNHRQGQDVTQAKPLG